MKVVIIGAGLTGLSVAYHLEKKGFTDYEIIEKEPRIGGLLKTERKNGFLFDYSGHVLHLNKSYTKRLLAKFLPRKFELHKRNAGVFFKDRITDYPFQENLYNIPLDVVKDCLVGFVNARAKNLAVKNFYDWIMKNFGIGFAKHFFIPYNTKLFKTDLKNLTCNWAKKFIPVPTLNEVINGIFKKTHIDSCGIHDSGSGYSSLFYYPSKGGISELLDFFLINLNAGGNINLSKKIKKIDLIKKCILFEDSKNIENFDVLVSTIPLPELIKVLYPISTEMINFAAKLNYISVLNLNIGLSSFLPTDKHWIYFPEKDKIFYRIGFPSNISKKVVPANCSSVSVEISYNKKYKGNKQRLIEEVKKQLIQTGLIKNKRDIIVELPIDIEYAYVIFDSKRDETVKVIMEYLKKNNVMSIGRYGAWEYSSMEDAIMSGNLAAEEILDTL